MHNKDIRQAIEAAGVKYWQVAEKLGIYDGNFSRLLRKELSGADKNRVLQAIKDAAAEKGGSENE